MTSSQLSPRFVVFVVVSLISHLMELAACGLFCHTLFQQGDLKAPWFSVTAGLVIIPLVAVQLVSAVMLLRRKGETSTSYEVTMTAVLHVLQLGFISRHFAVLQEAPIPSKRAEVVELLILRASYAVTTGCTVFLAQIYLLLRDAFDVWWLWAAYVSEVTLLISITWALSTFRKCVPDHGLDLALVAWPGTLLKLLWRGGEILTRMISLGLFASIYTHWVFLVLGLHWAAMLVCVCIPVMGSSTLRSQRPAQKFLYSLITSYTYIFAFINTCPENTVFRYTFYYVIMFLENATLLAVWLIQSNSREFSNNCPFLYVAAFVFVMSVVSMIVYYKFFHLTSDKDSPENRCRNENCLACKMGNSTHHPPSLVSSAANDGLVQQCHHTDYCGPFCKHSFGGSLLDSERNSTATASSLQARLQQKLASCSDERLSNHLDKNDVSSSSISNTDATSHDKSRKRGKGKTTGQPNTSESELSSIRTELDRSEDDHSSKRPVWLPSGDSNFANQLLTCSLETFNAADDERSSVGTSCRGYHSGENPKPAHKTSFKDLPHRKILSQRSAEHRWYSDGYSTDRSAELPQILTARTGKWAGDGETAGECCQCCDGSEVSSIIRSITTVPESVEDDQELPSHLREIRHKKLHHHPPCQQIHRSNLEDLSGIGNEDSGVSLDVPGSRHNMSSPASDPSHGPKTKKSRSAKRHDPPHHKTTTSKLQKKNDSMAGSMAAGMAGSMAAGMTDSITTHLPPINVQREHGDTPAQQNQQLKDKPGGATKINRKMKGSMSPVHVSSNPVHGSMNPVHGTMNPVHGTTSLIQGSTNPIQGSTNPIHGLAKPARKTQSEETLNQTPDKAVDKAGLQTASQHISHCSEVLTAKLPTLELLQSKAHVVSRQDTNTDALGQQTTPDIPGKLTDVVYENIWQTGQIKHSKHTQQQGGQIFILDNSHIKSDMYVYAHTRDTKYVCSESEDSALPPEILNSSIDCFTPSESESDLSLEIVI
ncbi:uncharacterized protein LOC131950703 [Physella acuta]|uniref:uncharacterized protein LOC131950703 n=1 Tax=Physella acuta TaxID=109671 RepID=UPI0027DB44BD|nr:uncharacterized protein LOC131950703 [Physella acuta]